MKNTTPPSLKALAVYAEICAAVFAAALLMAGPSQAQTVYRVTGPDGRVTFSDKPPATADKGIATRSAGNAMAPGETMLPFELRKVAAKYAVTLYTSANCAPCGSGRALLTSRGIPFAEKTVNTPEDADALQRISGESSLPFLTIGGQQIKGYSDSEWTQFLDAAGYPKSSVLPASYRNATATALVALQKQVLPAKPEETQAPARPSTPTAPDRPAPDTKSNPAGITF